jgi:hypothetical protein
MEALRPEHYLQAAKERLTQAEILYKQGDCYALSMYTAGVAVECLLRAFKVGREKSIDERHDLRRLFDASGVQQLFSPSDVRALRASLNAICELWSNMLRFASEARTLAWLKKNPVLRHGIKGDILKENARRLLEATQIFVSKGVGQWTSSLKRGSS